MADVYGEYVLKDFSSSVRKVMVLLLLISRCPLHTISSSVERKLFCKAKMKYIYSLIRLQYRSGFNTKASYGKQENLSPLPEMVMCIPFVNQCIFCKFPSAKMSLFCVICTIKETGTFGAYQICYYNFKYAFLFCKHIVPSHKRLMSPLGEDVLPFCSGRELLPQMSGLSPNSVGDEEKILNLYLHRYFS